MSEVRARHGLACQRRSQQSLDLPWKHIPDQLQLNLKKTENVGTSRPELEKKPPRPQKSVARGGNVTAIDASFLHSRGIMLYCAHS